MSQTTLKLGPQSRSITLDRAAVQQDSRTLSLAFASEQPVERYWGVEILDLSPGAMRLGRMNAGAPLLCDHNTRCQVGIVETISIGTDRVARADVRFGKSARAEEEYQDVLDGIRTSVSVGYIIHAMSLESTKDGMDTYRITDWEPYEISMVSVPADYVGSGVGRGSETTWKEQEITITVKTSEVEQEISDPEEIETETTATADPNTTSTKERQMEITVDDARKEARTEEQHRVREMMAIADKHPAVADMAREFINSGKPLDEFRTAALEKLSNAQPVNVTADIGMSAREIKQYSIVRAMQQIAENGKLDGLEREASEATSKIAKREARGFFIPQDIMAGQFKRSERALTAGNAAAGGFTVDSQLMVSDMIELLRNKTLVSQLGARTLSGLVGNIAIPRVAGGATAYWLAENGVVTASDQAFGQLGLTPHRLVGDTAYSKELLIQSSMDVEAFVREDLMRVLAIEKDRAAINGLGAFGEPLGILNTTGIGSVTFGAAATWAKVLAFETAVANANADIGNMAYLTTPTTRGVWKGAVKVTNQAVFLWENNEVNGYPAAATKQVPSEKVIFGNFNDLIIAEWAGIDVVVDPYSLKKSGQIEVTTTLWTDVGVRHPGSFAVSTDSGAQ